MGGALTPEDFKKLAPLQFIEYLAEELKKDYEFYMTRLEDTPSSNSAFDYLSGYTDYCEETAGLVERYLNNAKRS
jgi:hypothetical protein